MSFPQLVWLCFQTLWVSDPRYRPPIWRRGLLFLFLLFIFLPWQAFNRIALLIDRLFFAFDKVELERAIFVTGVPRSGTTLLHRLLVNDQPQVTTFRLWELLFAPAVIQKIPMVFLHKLDGKIGRPCGRFCRWVERLVLGKLDKVHGTSLNAPEEDYLSLIPFGGCFLLVHLFPYSEHIWALVKRTSDPSDQATRWRRRMIDIYLSLVQRHLFVFGREKMLVSKNPAFTTWISDLQDAVPQAIFLTCHRDPKDAIPSLISSMESGALLTGNQENESFQRALIEMMEGFYRVVLEDCRERDRHRNVAYVDLTTRPLEVLRQICKDFGINSVAFHEKLVKACHTATNYRSQHRYDAGQFGLEIDRIRLELNAYHDE